jgi:hypothetical protein
MVDTRHPDRSQDMNTTDEAQNQSPYTPPVSGPDSVLYPHMVGHLRGWYREARTAGDHETADRIRVVLAAGGEVVYPPGSPEYAQYRADLTDALAEWVNGD